MSSEGSQTTNSSRLSQFGLYRTIDARTEEFLRLSRKRQIRQGCACAAVSTAITVTVVVVILLIYEYAIAVESSLVQRIRSLHRFNNGTNETFDNPVADRLDRSYFGFDQDYFERMPLLVNAMQENSYVDPATDAAPSKHKARFILTNYTYNNSHKHITTKHTTTTSDYRNSIRRTSPRPFIFEYKSPTPTPFSKTYGSRSWIDSYRNAQRLKNLQQVIKYLEKTINAKFGDVYTLPTIAFTGVYMEPTTKDKVVSSKTPSNSLDLLLQSSNKAETFKSNHYADPLYSYKPESPGDVNMLADSFLRFSPIPTSSTIRETIFPTVPMFRPISSRKKFCIGVKCNENDGNKNIKSQNNGEIKSTDVPYLDKAKTFSVMLNLFPLKPTSFDYKNLETVESTPPMITKYSITTTRPIIQFRRRSTTPIRRASTRFKRPRMFNENNINRNRVNNLHHNENKVVEPKMIVHVNVFPPAEVTNQDKATTDSNTLTTQTSVHRYATEMPMLTSTQVEDYHAGSSGIIPIESRMTPAPAPPISTFPTSILTTHPTVTTKPTLPTITTMIPFFDTPSSSTETHQSTPSSTEIHQRVTPTEIHSWVTNPPEIVKFSPEDAKIPDQYANFPNFRETSTTSTSQPVINRRNSPYSIIMRDVEPSTLIVKLKNDVELSTKQTKSETTTEQSQETTTMRTYVPQINGHYRSVNVNSKNINTWLNGETEKNRKRRLEMSVTGFRKSTYVPQYVVIKRNNTRNSSDEDI